MNRPEPQPKPATRIQQRNRQAILEAALQVFSARGFRGSTIDRIAERAGLSKPNLLYYFPSKQAIYLAVLEDTLEEWLQPLRELDPKGDPTEEIGRYIAAKLEMSRTRPAASRLFANEILHGAPLIGEFLSGPLKRLVDEKTAVIDAWIAEGRIVAIDPRHLIMMVWAVTQHYADFEAQVGAVLGPDVTPAERYGSARRTIAGIILDGLRPR
jgi:TetR/AcrR family transcriptional regulator